MLKKLVMVAVVASLALPAFGTTYTLTSGTSVVEFDDVPDNVSSWIVGGGDEQLFQETFYYRVSGDNSESSFGELNMVEVETQGPDQLIMLYEEDAEISRFSVEVYYDLDHLPSGESRLLEFLAIQNDTEEELTMQLFEYADFDLNSDADDDTVEIVFEDDQVYARQSDSEGPVLSEGTATINPDRVEAGFVFEEDSILDRLDDGDVDDLDNTTLIAEDGDVAWAFQWEIVLPAGESTQVCKIKTLSPIPEPLTLFGAMMSVAGLAGYIRKRRNA